MLHAPAVVFITAYDRYAITAFELGALDYLLKPVIPERFSLALRRIQERGSAKTTVGNVADRLSLLKSNDYLRQFAVRHQNSIFPVQVEDIVRLEADDDYTAIYTLGKRLMVHVPLRDLTARLSPDTFVRVHRCSVINLAHVHSSRSSDRRMFLQMSDKSVVRVSRTGMQALKDLHLKRQTSRRKM